MPIAITYTECVPHDDFTNVITDILFNSFRVFFFVIILRAAPVHIITLVQLSHDSRLKHLFLSKILRLQMLTDE